MARVSRCVRCDVPINWSETEDGERIPLEARGSTIPGPGRYVFADDEANLVLKVDASVGVYAYRDHRQTCPK